MLLGLSENNLQRDQAKDKDYLDILVNNDIYDDFGKFLLEENYNSTTVGHYQNAIRILREQGWLNKYKTLFEDCVSIDDLKAAFKRFFSIPEIDEFNRHRHHDLSAMSKQLIEYINHKEGSGTKNCPTDDASDNNDVQINNETVETIDWEAMFTDSNGRLMKIANPELIDKLRPYL